MTCKPLGSIARPPLYVLVPRQRVLVSIGRLTNGDGHFHLNLEVHHPDDVGQRVVLDIEVLQDEGASVMAKSLHCFFVGLGSHLLGRGPAPFGATGLFEKVLRWGVSSEPPHTALPLVIQVFCKIKDYVSASWLA